MVELIDGVVPPPPPGWAQLPPEDIAALRRVLDGVAAARLVGAR
jgi:hypothetical protein